MFKITLTAARVNAGFTLDDVAQKIHKTKGTIIAWEKGKTSIDVHNFKELCDLYNVPMEFIILPSNSTQSGIEQEEVWKK